MYYTDIYYSKNANGKIISWRGEVNGVGAIKIITGHIDGKQRTIYNTMVKPKGKLTKYEQAVKELKAKAKLKKDKGYKTLEDLNCSTDRLEEVLTVNKTDSNDILKPMKAKPFVVGKCKYPMICQPKINGFRNTAMLVKDLAEAGNMFATGKTSVKLLTKEGHEYVVPHISESMSYYMDFESNIVFDGELYVHNEILSNINRRIPKRKKDSSTISKTSLPIEPLTFCIFDLSIPDMNQLDRLKLKDEILLQAGEIYYSEIYYNSNSNRYFINKSQHKTGNNIINVRATIVHSDEEALKHRDAAIVSGFEGVILRDLDAEYIFGGRRNNMFKYKGLKHSEFKITDVILKNEDSVRTYVAFKCKNDLNDLTFEVTAHGTEEDRQEYINHPEDYIGKTLTLGFGERTVKGLPFHIKEMSFRESYDLDSNDLNIEI